jgi:hypothetical protein
MASSLANLDRRWIFLAMGTVVVVLFAAGLKRELPVSQYVQSYYDTIEELPEGSTVLLSADFDPASAAELLPTYQATIHHLMRRNMKVINVATWPAAPPYTRAEFAKIAEGTYGKTYGEDWIELGFKPGDDVAMAQIGQDLRTTFPVDEREGRKLSDFPVVMEGVSDSLQGIAVLITMSAGYPGILEWIAQVGGRYDIRILTATTAVQTPDLFAYYPSQLAGFCGAATGATQYLQLVTEGMQEDSELVATTLTNQKRMAIQTWGHMLIILLIVAGNVIYFVGKRS